MANPRISRSESPEDKLRILALYASAYQDRRPARAQSILETQRLVRAAPWFDPSLCVTHWYTGTLGAHIMMAPALVESATHSAPIAAIVCLAGEGSPQLGGRFHGILKAGVALAQSRGFVAVVSIGDPMAEDGEFEPFGFKPGTPLGFTLGESKPDLSDALRVRELSPLTPGRVVLPPEIRHWRAFPTYPWCWKN